MPKSIKIIKGEIRVITDHMASLKISIIMVCLNFTDLVAGYSETITQLLIPSKNFARLLGKTAI